MFAEDPLVSSERTLDAVERDRFGPTSSRSSSLAYEPEDTEPASPACWLKPVHIELVKHRMNSQTIKGDYIHSGASPHTA